MVWNSCSQWISMACHRWRYWCGAQRSGGHRFNQSRGCHGVTVWKVRGLINQSYPNKSRYSTYSVFTIQELLENLFGHPWILIAKPFGISVESPLVPFPTAQPTRFEGLITTWLIQGSMTWTFSGVFVGRCLMLAHAYITYILNFFAWNLLPTWGLQTTAIVQTETPFRGWLEHDLEIPCGQRQFPTQKGLQIWDP